MLNVDIIIDLPLNLTNILLTAKKILLEEWDHHRNVKLIIVKKSC